jgi:hypothetical protein
MQPGNRKAPLWTGAALLPLAHAGGRLLPPASEVVWRRQAELVIGACLFLIAMLAALLVFWRLSRDLEIKTVLAFGGLGVILAGLIALAGAGQPVAAAWILAGGSLAIITAFVGLYGTDGPVMAWYLVPILLLAAIGGRWAALGTALFATVVIWLSALAQQAGRYTPPWSELPFHRMYVTFNVPIMSALYWLTALMAGIAWAP